MTAATAGRVPASAGMVGPHRTAFVPVHREDNETPVALALTLMVPMSIADIVATLWVVVAREGMGDLAEFAANPGLINEMVCETMLAEGGARVARARTEIATMHPGHERYPVLCELQRLVTGLYVHGVIANWRTDAVPAGQQSQRLRDQHVRLKDALRVRRWTVYRTFCREYDKAAKVVDPALVGHYPSRAQLHRWTQGKVKGLPLADHCRVLEQMFGREWTAEQLFELCAACPHKDTPSLVHVGEAARLAVAR